MKIVLASSNKGKIAEINDLLQGSSISVIPQSDQGVTDIEETGITFIENALLKARNAAQETSLPAIADDSGLVVPYLQGEPGIYSARYASPEVNHAKNIEKLLNKLQSVPEKDRQAFFYCIIVYLQHAKDPCPIVCEGIWHGQILTSPRGEHGFGYDPVFFDSRYHLSAAELDMATKNKISHRGQAISKLIHHLTK